MARCLVCTPPDYDRQPLARCPVLYLLPGYGEDELGWFNQGRANVILYNLIAAKMAVPMLVVSDDQFTALKPGQDAGPDAERARTSEPTGKDSLK